MFNVVCLETGELEPDYASGAPKVHDTGAGAAACAKALSAATGQRWQVRPVLNTAWREREAQRLLDGTYTRLPGDLNGDRYYRELTQAYKWMWFDHMASEETAHHYAHVSSKVPGNIAFTETDDKGARDIQTSMKPGRYLARFYPKLSQDDIRTYANQFIAKFGAINLHWATTADEFEHVYTNGPNSCMAHPASEYASHMHPVRVYAAGDIELAYLKASDGENESISARVLVWKARKLYSRIYGDADKLAALLGAEGYRHGSLDGARMLRVEDEESGRLIVPYVDQSYHAREHGKYLIIDIAGDVDCEQTNGLANDGRERCSCCNGHFYLDNLYSVEGADGLVCESCESENTYYCQYNEQSYWGDDYVMMADGSIWSQDAFDRHGFECEGSHKNYHNDDCVTLSDGTHWSQSYFEDHGSVCAGNGDCYASEGMVEGRDGDYYSQDYLDDNPHLDPAVPEASEDTEDDTVLLVERKRAARQGRDEDPSQLEMPLAHEAA